MTRQVSEDLKDFYLWLQNICFVQKRTATVYSSLVRSILKDQSGVVTSEGLAIYVSGVSDPVKRSTLKTAWKKYVVWMKEIHLFVLPDFPASPPRAERKVLNLPDLPDDVTAALYFCVRRCGVSLSDMDKIVWGCVFKTRVPYRTFVKLSPDDTKSYALPDRCVEIFRSYACPKNDYTPFIPRNPGSQLPYPLLGLKKALQDYEKAWLAAEQEGKVLEGVFNPYVECQSFHFPEKESNELPEAPPVENIVKPIQPANLDVPLERSITTNDLLARLYSTGSPKSLPFTLDFSSLDYRGMDYPGDWRYLYGCED